MHEGSLTIEVLCSLGEVGSAHHVETILELSAFLEHSLFLLLLHHVDHVRVVLVIEHHLLLELSLVFPLDLELSHSGLLNEDVASELVNHGLGRRVLIKLLLLVVVVHVVTNSEELLVVVGTGKKNASHSHDILLRKPVDLWHFALFKFELRSLW